MIVWMALTVLLSASLSVAIPLIVIRKASAEVHRILNDTVEAWNKELEAIKPTISRAYGIIGSQGAQARQVQKAEKLIAEDIIGQYPEIKAVLGAISPRTQEYLEENPDILVEVINRWGPKIQYILGQKGLEGIMQNIPGLSDKTEEKGIEWAWRE